MRSYHGAQLVGGAVTDPRQALDDRGFIASFTGTCRGCGRTIKKGSRIQSPGHGLGAYHIDCKIPAGAAKKAHRYRLSGETKATQSAVRAWNQRQRHKN
jgi:hypothetical protein